MTTRMSVIHVLSDELRYMFNVIRTEDESSDCQGYGRFSSGQCGRNATEELHIPPRFLRQPTETCPRRIGSFRHKSCALFSTIAAYKVLI